MRACVWRATHTHTHTHMIPVRCYTCNCLIAHRWEEYKRRREEGAEEPYPADVGRMCCRRMFLGCADVHETEHGNVDTFPRPSATLYREVRFERRISCEV